MEIVYSSTKLLNIKPLTVVNGNACYEIEVKDKECPFKHKFMCTLQSTKFIAMMHAGNLHIFNLMQDGMFPEDFRSYIDANREHLIKILNLSDSFQIHEFNRENPHNLTIIIPDSPPQCKFLDLNAAKGIIRVLNIELQETCPGFYLHIDYLTSFPTGSTVTMYSAQQLNYFIMPPLLLCLMHRNECVSSITMEMDKSIKDIMTIQIYSRTDPRYRKRGFNALLRAVAIMISKGLNERAEQLVSDAINITSALLMIKHFNAVSQEGDISNRTVEPKNLDQVVKDYFHQHDDRMNTMVELNEENIANATTVFRKTIAKINCRSVSVRRHRSASPSPFRRKTTSVPRHRSAPGRILLPEGRDVPRATTASRRASCSVTRSGPRQMAHTGGKGKTMKTYKKVNPKHNKCVF